MEPAVDEEARRAKHDETGMNDQARQKREGDFLAAVKGPQEHAPQGDFGTATYGHKTALTRVPDESRIRLSLFLAAGRRGSRCGTNPIGTSYRLQQLTSLTVHPHPVVIELTELTDSDSVI